MLKLQCMFINFKFYTSLICLRLRVRILSEKVAEKINNNFDSYRNYILSLKQIIDESLSKLISMIPFPILRSRIEYALLGGGKRLRPLITLLSAKSVGGKINNAIKLALAVELIHNASLVHDDIIDQSKYRRRKLALHEKWSKSDAIVTGDALIAIAINLISEYGQKVIKVASEGALNLCGGELVDATMKLTEVDEEVYFRDLILKSSALFKVAAECGGIVGGGSEVEIKALSSYGENYGIAYQLKDDLEDALDREILLVDLKNGRVTYPLVYLYNYGSKKVREVLFDYISNVRNITIEGVDEIIGEIKRLEIMDKIKEKISKYIENACRELDKLRETKYRDMLIFLANQISSGFKDLF